MGGFGLGGKGSEGVQQVFTANRDSPGSGLILRRLRRGPRCLSPQSGRVLGGPGADKPGFRWQYLFNTFLVQRSRSL